MGGTIKPICPHLIHIQVLSALNTRLKNYLEENDLLGEEQAGFREGYATLDHIFSLHCIIDLALAQKKRLYYAFVDYLKAFDMVDRSSLWVKISATISLSTFYELLLCRFPRLKVQTYMGSKGNKPKTSKRGKC